MNDYDQPRSVRIEPAGWTFDAPRGASLLEAAERARLRLPSSCRNGTCRTCMCRLASGRVSYRIEWPGLLPEEKAQGFILPCVARAESDLVIEAHAVPDNASGARRA